MDIEKLKAALEIRFDSDAGENLRVKDYLRALLRTLWVEQEGFDAKRPFGNSDWDYELYRPLAEHGFIDARQDCCGELAPADYNEAHCFVLQLIEVAFD